MKLKKCIFSVVMLLMLCLCFVLNNSSGFAVARYVELYDDDSYLNNTYNAGEISSDSGKISCAPLKATYTNNKYEDSLKEVWYKLFKIQAGAVTQLVLSGSKSKEGRSSSLVTESYSDTALRVSYRRYAYGMTYKSSSAGSGLAGTASITIERTYPEVKSGPEVNEFDMEGMETDYTQQEKPGEEDESEPTGNSEEEYGSE